MRACMIAYTFYESDSRVMMYANALAKRGDRVDIISLRKKGKPFHERIDGIEVYRIQKRILNESSMLSYLIKLLWFLIKSFAYVTYKHIKRPYDLIHVHSVPDFEVFVAIIPKMFGAKIILDIHDIVPEFYASKFNKSKKSLLYKVLIYIEKISAFFSDHVIIANDIWRETITARSIDKNKCTVVLNYPDPSLFRQIPKTRNDNKIIIIYPGSLNWHQGVDIAVKAFAILVDKVPTVEFHIYGEGSEEELILKFIEHHNLENKVFIMDKVSTNEIPQIIANSDVGVVPKRDSLFGGEAFSTKIFEFMAVGIPTIVSATKIDQYYFNDSLVMFFKPGDERNLAEKMLLLISNKQLRKKLINNSLEFVKKNNWDFKKHIYLDLVDSLVKTGR